MKTQESEKTVVTLANASELVRCIAQAVVGNDIADTFGGSDLTSNTLYNLAQTSFQKKVQPYIQSEGV